MGLINALRRFLLRKYEAKLDTYNRVVASVSQAISHVDMVYNMVAHAEVVDGDITTEELKQKLNLDMLNSIKRDLKIALKSCELMGQEIDGVDFDTMKWWDFRYLDRIAKREENVVNSLKSLKKQIQKFSHKAMTNLF